MSEEGLRPGPTGLYSRRRLLQLGAAGAAGAFLAACGKKAGVASTTTTTARVPVTSSGGGPSGHVGSSATPGTAGGESGGPAFASSISSNGRYLLDQYGRPFFILGDSAWGLAANISLADMATYFSTRQSQGFNTALVELVADTYSSISPNNARTFDGINAFTGTAGGYPDLSTPNSTYWVRMDLMVSLAATHGITLLLVPADCASSFGDSYCMSMVRANGAAACTNYGKWLGTRYGGSPNVIWMHGNDYGTAAPWGTDDQYVGNICQGIQAIAPHSLHTAEILPGLNASSGGYEAQSTLWPKITQFGQAYNWLPPDQIAQYNSSPTMPMFMGEGQYDGLAGVTNYQVRAQAYWTMVEGGTGQFYGQATLWQFKSGWQSRLTSTSVTETGYWANFFRGINWWTLVPDQSNTFLTGGISSGTTRSSGALAADGSLGVVYAPSANPQVDMSKMRGSTLVRWYDPTAGTFTTVGASPFPNSGTQSFPNPGKHGDGSHDWVLVLTA